MIDQPDMASAQPHSVRGWAVAQGLRTASAVKGVSGCVVATQVQVMLRVID